MTDYTELNKELANLGSKLEAFLKAQDPPLPVNEQPAVDETVKHIKSILASIPEPTAKRPFVKPDAPHVDPVVQPAKPVLENPFVVKPTEPVVPVAQPVHSTVLP